MTELTPGKKTKRQALAVYRGRPLVIELDSHSLTIREKGKRKGYEVPYEAIYTLGAKKAAEQQRAEKKAARKGREVKK